MFAAAACLCDPNDEVLVFEPAYVTYDAVLGATGASLVQVPLRPERAFHVEPDAMARAITTRTRAVMLNFPHNPTGACLTAREAAAVAELCRAHDLWCISDEVYATLHFGVAQFVQDAGVTALESGATELEYLRSAYERRARAVVEALAAAPGLLVRMPDAGMYIFADVRATGLDGKQFARRLLDAEGVAVTPGEGFGASGAGHVRITLGVGETRLLEACRRITRFAASCRS